MSEGSDGEVSELHGVGQEEGQSGAPRFCGQCGNAVNGGARFCADCGAPLGFAGAPAAAAVLEAPIDEAGAESPAQRRSRRVTGVRRGGAGIFLMISQRAGKLALALWLYHLFIDAQLGSVVAGHPGLSTVPTVTSDSTLSATLGHLSHGLLVIAVAGAIATLVVARPRSEMLLRLGRWLLPWGIGGLIYVWAIQHYLGHSTSTSNSSLVTGLLRIAAPMQDIYLAMTAAGLAVYWAWLVVSWFERRSGRSAKGAATPQGRTP